MTDRERDLDPDHLASAFERERARLRGVAYRILGSLSEADDAVQEAWLRLSRSDVREVANLAGWLTTVVSRLCLDELRSRRVRREEALDGPRDVGPADPGSEPAGGTTAAAAADPEQEALLADAVGVALLVVLDKLEPAERLAFVLHDLVDMPFDEIAAIVERSPAATRQLASRARRRVQGAAADDDAPPDDAPPTTAQHAAVARQRATVDAFLAALRGGDVEGLVAVLDPELVVRIDAGPPGMPREVRGARTWAPRAVAGFARALGAVHPALVDGSVGLLFAPRGRLQRAVIFTFDGGRIATLDVITDAAHLARLDLAVVP